MKFNLTFERIIQLLTFVGMLVTPVYIFAAQGARNAEDHRVLQEVQATVNETQQRVARIEGQLAGPPRPRGDQIALRGQ